MKVYRLLLIAALCLAFPCAWTQTTQYGLVEEYQGKQPKTALPHVIVAASNAGVAQSGVDGRFELNFRTLHAGDAIQFRRVELSGYEVMNTEALEVQRVALWSGEGVPAVDDPALVRIVMAPRAVLQKLRDDYRAVASRRYEQQLQLNEKELERLRREGKLAEEQYNARMNALEEEYEEKLSKLETYIDKFARIDLSDLDQDEQRIVELVQQGKFEEALQIYEDQHLQERLKQNRSDIQQLTAVRAQLDEAARKKEQEIVRLRQSIDRQVTLLLMAGGEDNYMKAHNIYRETFLADTTYTAARRDYSRSLRNLGEDDEAARLLRDGIEVEKDLFLRGMLYIDLAHLYWLGGNQELSLRYAQGADSVLTPYINSIPQVLSRALPSWSDFQLRYYFDQGDMAACQPIADRMMQLWAPDTLLAVSLYDYLSVLTVMTDYYSTVGDSESALWCARQTLALNPIYEKKAPTEPSILDGYLNVCYTLMNEGKEQEAWQSVRHAAKLMDQHVKMSGARQVYETLVVHYYSLMEVLVAGQQYALADSIMQSEAARKVFARAVQSRNSVTNLKEALYHYYEARVMLQMGRVEESEALAKKWLEVIAADEEGSGLVPYLQPDYLARYCLARGQYKEAVKQCNQLIELAKAAYAESQDAWDADNLCRYYLLLAEVHRAAGNQGKFQKTMDLAKSVAVYPFHKKMIAELEK